MRKALFALLVLLMMFAVPSAFACGEKGAARVDAAEGEAGSPTVSLTAQQASAVAASATETKAAVKSDQASDAKSYVCGAKTATGKASKASVSRLSETDKASLTKSGCYKAGAKVQKASAKGSGHTCSVSASCPIPCNKATRSTAAKADDSPAAPETSNDSKKQFVSLKEATASDK